MFNGFHSLLFCLSLTSFLANAEFSRPESAHYYAAENVFFVSSTNGSEKGWISKLDANGRVIEARWADQLQRPMGMRVFGDRLFVASWGNLDPRRPGSWATIEKGGMYSLSLSQPDDRDWLVRSVGNLDGLEMTSDGDIYFSDWGSGRLYLLKVGETQSTVIGEFGRGLADIGLNSETGELLLPQMLNNRVELVRP